MIQVVPSAILAALIHPYNSHIYISQVLWASFLCLFGSSFSAATTLYDAKCKGLGFSNRYYTYIVLF